ncbi:allophanate hydrolase subunit 2-domain-containing protein [Aspergillus avenaceus]|uniref:Allophanate hydrolase subunit 2-domain-containing protein n=1 Tax=Aspergillus avenaceus TaxID=36643 RepID=A0A5N6TYG4_ASPAV|nr:allophanate hydrolase subunit 2-domain-containing protein [Aspergillus avenaceus]
MESEPLRHISKVLVANRGEIAVRCLRACRELGVQSVAIITGVDGTSLHARLADEVVTLPGSDSTAYTDGKSILNICKDVGADAVIPGYGFFSENVEFAEAAVKAGITFGYCREREYPGHSWDAAAHIRDACSRMCAEARVSGYNEDEIEKAFALVESRADALFKNSSVFLEKYYPHSRHVEVQVAGNGETVVTFGERECSLQRRHQKVIEESPSPFVEHQPGFRGRMMEAAKWYALQLNYKSVGTVEFLVDDETADFFFLEMNTRLQVEHGISELCYGVDLVHLMLRQADYEHGGHLGMPSEILQGLGRPCSRVPLRSFAPSPGVLQSVVWPEGEGVRVDTWVQSGQRIPVHYDPLIGKVMVHSPDGRAAAQQKMLSALANTTLQGTQTNLDYLCKILQSDIFTTGYTLTNSLSTFVFQACAMQVLDPGLFTTVQDYPGRIDIGYGVPPSGLMDDLSSRAANIIVGNSVEVELLEVTLTGPELLFHEFAVVAVCGARIPVTVDGVEQPMWSRIIVRQGQVLKLGSITGSGSRSYIAIRGSFPQIPTYLGSKSTTPELQLGGIQGRRLETHDILEISSKSAIDAANITPISLSHGATPDYNVKEIYCLEGPFGSGDILSPEGKDAIVNSQWTVNHDSSRSGVRLRGPRIKWSRARGGGGGSHPSNVFDYGYSTGGVNWTGESPIILMRDRQLKSGDAVQFRMTTFDNAQRIRRAKDAYLQALASYVQQKDDAAIPALCLDIGTESTPSILKTKLATPSHPRVTFRQSGDTGIVVEFGEQVADLRNTASVKLLSEQPASRNLSGVRYEPNIATLTVHYDPYQLSQSSLLQILDKLDDKIAQVPGMQFPAREVHLPLCLDHPSMRDATQRYVDSIRPTASYLPDNVEYLRKANALESRSDVFDALLKTPWLAVAVGFFVGTPILFPLDPRYLYPGQKYSPNRTYTPSGSVGLGGSLLGLYPVASPGGYQLMGRTLSAWDTAGTRPGFSAAKPWLFDQYDIVKFYQVTVEEFNQAEQDFLAGRYQFKITTATLDMDHYIVKFDAAARDPACQDWQRRQAIAPEEMNILEQRLFDEWSVAKTAAGQGENGAEADLLDKVLISSPVDANVWKVHVKAGDVLEKGQVVAILEAMKMEIQVLVGEGQEGATVTSILCQPGSITAPGTTILPARISQMYVRIVFLLS